MLVGGGRLMSNTLKLFAIVKNDMFDTWLQKMEKTFRCLLVEWTTAWFSRSMSMQPMGCALTEDCELSGLEWLWESP